MSVYTNVLFPFALTAVLVLLFRPLAVRTGLVDVPVGRKFHIGNIPLSGGAAVFFGLLVSMLSLDIPILNWWPLLAAAALLLLVGLWDDYKGVGVRHRFLVQIGAVLLVAVWGGVRLDNLGNLLGFGVIELGLIAVPFTVFGAVGVMNAFNMIDGMDGLSSGLGLILLGILCSLLWAGGHAAELHFVLLVFSCLAGFFLFNFRFTNQQQAFVFLGDSGSLFLGGIIAFLLIKYSQEPYNLIRPVTALWLFAIPLMDTVSTMLRRARTGRSPFDADHGHLHHIFQKAGLGVRRSAVLIFTLQGVLCITGLGGDYFNIPEYQMFYAFMALFSLYYLAVTRPWLVGQVCQRFQRRAVVVAER